MLAWEQWRADLIDRERQWETRARASRNCNVTLLVVGMTPWICAACVLAAIWELVR